MVELLEAFHGFLHGGVLNVGHGAGFLPVFQKSHPSGQGRVGEGALPAAHGPVSLAQLHPMQLQLVTQAHGGVVPIAQLEVPQRRGVPFEQIEI